ncbi:hypothetical protein MKW94_007890 [Papaver nudicaule]|uniref:Uncharacterized protein n=1 Tax=Papaver nudicaule TaxID=74823 RepID=A0AA41RL61_PAPNU|nr:hypothetical protein [Papaver nudicaule]
MFMELKEMNQALVAKERFYTEELQEAHQRAYQEIATRQAMVGVRTMRKGEQVLWNFREGTRATLK